MAVPRSITRSFVGQETPEGRGAVVLRSIGRPELRSLDPFLLLDEFRGKPPAGFPDHPHRGFETVSYMLQGAFSHEDHLGHKGTLRAGDLQWMTAGRGIVHAEMPASMQENRGLQLWVNLAASEKMCDPRYQELLDKDIPRANSSDGKVVVKVISGESIGVRSPVHTKTETMYLDIMMKPHAEFTQPVPAHFNGFIYTLEGKAIFGANEVDAGTKTTLALGDGDFVTIRTQESESRFVLIAGKPHKEPVVQYGLFVMNTQEQVKQAMIDYQKGQNGFEKAVGFRSSIYNGAKMID